MALVRKLPSSIVLDDESPFLQRENRNCNYSAEEIAFAEFAKKTFRRYEESNLTIDTFILRLKSDSYALLGLATEWTLNALKLGATDLTFRSVHSSIAIPLTEVFGNENVVRLCLQKSSITHLKVTKLCPGLKSLTLSDLTITTTAPFFDLISCCPSVENLSLSNIYSGYACDKNIHEHVESPPPPTIILHELRSLVLCGVDSKFQFETLFLDDLSSKFPNLKHLTLGLALLSLCPTLDVIRSVSLETLNIMDDASGMYYHKVQQERPIRPPRFDFDVPSIRRFAFEGKYILGVSFRSMSGYQWEESHISLTRNGTLSTKWFRELRGFLTKMKGSKIYLCLHVDFDNSFDYDVGELDGLTVCEVEDLTLDIKDLPSMSCHALLDGLFRICRPKTITQYPRPHDSYYCKKLIGKDLFICWTLERAMQAKSSLLVSSQFMYGSRDLEEIDAQQLVGEVWKPQPLGSILAGADSPSEESKRRFRLQLKWKPCLNPYDDDDYEYDDDYDSNYSSGSESFGF